MAETFLKEDGSIALTLPVSGEELVFAQPKGYHLRKMYSLIKLNPEAEVFALAIVTNAQGHDLAYFDEIAFEDAVAVSEASSSFRGVSKAG